MPIVSARWESARGPGPHGGSDWRTNPQTQIRWGEDYIQSRYGSSCQAWAFWRARTYYGPLLAVMP